MTEATAVHAQLFQRENDVTEAPGLMGHQDLHANLITTETPGLKESQTFELSVVEDEQPE